MCHPFAAGGSTGGRGGSSAGRALRRAFTLTEMLVVTALILVLIALLLPALVGVRQQAGAARSMSGMRQIALWVAQYGNDHRDHVVPSQFNYADDPYPGKVRSGPVSVDPDTQLPYGRSNSGTWTDILWSVNGLCSFPAAGGPRESDYRHDSPDKVLYRRLGRFGDNPFRSALANTRQVPDGDIMLPFGDGAREVGEPGFFAANGFFNADRESATYSGWFTHGQIVAPERSVYLVDSFAGEVIGRDCLAWYNPMEKLKPCSPEQEEERMNEPTTEVDFRYGGTCLMLLLDGHVETHTPWQWMRDLEGAGGRGLRIRTLTWRGVAECECLPCGPECCPCVNPW